MLIYNWILLLKKQVITRHFLTGIILFFCFFGFQSNAHVRVGSPRPLSPFSLSFVSSDYNGFNISCNGFNDGSIKMSITGGTAPFTISWSNGDTIENISALVAGTYVVTVTDSDGTSLSDSVLLIQPSPINITGIITDVKCNGDNSGAIDITATNGAGSFSYLWSNNDVTEDLINLPAAIYTVTVTDINSCTDSASFQIIEPFVLTITSSMVDSVNCFGGNDGAITLTIYAVNHR